MQPDQTAGLPNQSLLFQSLKPYLENQTRQQPIIGLDSITECVKADSCNQEPLYLCEVCKDRMKRTDVRNHIMGTLHRYRYIKAQHPDLTKGWGHAVDVPKLAWPLMEMATVLEKREGPGQVKVLHLSAKAFKEMGERSPAIAISQLTAVRGQQMQKLTPPPSELAQTGAVKSQRVQSSQRKNGPAKAGNATAKCQRSNVQLQHLGVETDPPMPEANAANFQRPMGESAEPRVPSEGRVNILDGHTVIGLDHVVECRGKGDGRSSCFLCHCCRVKSDPDHFIDHLTCPSHISNYLMEVYPECVDAMMGGLNGEKELLQSVALKVAHIEGRGEHKVLELPEHLCDQLSDKTYHWCVKFFSADTSAARQKNTESLKVVEAFLQLTSAGGEGGEAGPERAAKKRRTGNETHPVFKVSMPMSKGAFVLERESFSLPDSTAVGAPPCPPASAPETLSTDPLDMDSRLDFGPLTVTLFEKPHSPPVASLPRHIEVQRADTEENIPVVIGHRKKTEHGLPHITGYTPHPKEIVQYNSDARACLIQQEPTQASDAGHPADRTGWPGSRAMEAGGPTTKTLPSCDVPIFQDLDAEKSNVCEKPAVAFYYCTPRGQRRP